MTTMQTILASQRKRLVVSVLAAALAIGWAGSAARADTITDDNVAAAVAGAKTAADHQALADYFTAKAKAALETVETHRTMAKALGAGKQGGSWEAHCHALMRTYKAQAADYNALAKEQAALAKGMGMGTK